MRIAYAVEFSIYSAHKLWFNIEISIQCIINRTESQTN